MSQLYDRAEIYDLIESEKRTEIIRRDWKLGTDTKGKAALLSL